MIEDCKKELLLTNLKLVRTEMRLNAIQNQADGITVIDCRQCVSYSDRGCNRTVLCVDAAMFKPKFAIQYWVKSNNYDKSLNIKNN